MGAETGAGFFETYLSHIILGLVMTFGYVAWRLLSRQKKEERPAKSLEEALREAEAEARRLSSARRAGEAEPDGSGLGLSPEQEIEREQVRRLADSPAAPATNHSKAGEGDDR